MQSITAFLQTIKARANELTFLGALMDEEDAMEKIFYGLVDEYKELVYVIQAHDTPITFHELHEKLLNFKASFHIKQLALDHFLALKIVRYK